MKFTLEIEFGNDAMQTSGEIATALHGVCIQLEAHYLAMQDADSALIRDTNGNTVGKWQVTA